MMGRIKAMGTATAVYRRQGDSRTPLDVDARA
jgi:hypothetical protein